MSTSQHSEGEANSNSESIVGPDTESLYTFIDRDSVHGLNLEVPEDASSVIKPWDEREDIIKYAESGVDDQLVIHVPFIQNVKVKSMLLKLGRGEVAPRRLMIFVNSVQIVDFEDVDSGARRPELDISLQAGQINVTEYPLRAAVFANVRSLSLHFREAEGGEKSRIYYIGFRGSTRVLKKEATQKLEVPAANAADAPLSQRMSERMTSQQDTAR
ncbi:DUF1000-domain-containing protein [Schizopora paradoxa]|uniref:DUF1000-domain-containing protein n=1 Tax=Schizopora paradoxa TaxID=27342 RepID=A0A0H2RP10_9AGAM|nr:DUF1000-domain-containing protein [Schizopora paradoxa]